MAKRRMFSSDIIRTDAFGMLSLGAQAVYFCLGVAADDDGFISSALTTTRAHGGSEIELNELVDAGYLMRFDSGIYLIRHWHLHNQIKKDRYTPTICLKEKSSVVLVNNIYYFPTEPECLQDGSTLEPQSSEEKDSIGKPSITKSSRDDKEPFSPPSLQELKEYAGQIGYYSFRPDAFLAYYNAHNWTSSNGNPVTDWKKMVDLWKAREKEPVSRPPSSYTTICDPRNYDVAELEKLINN